MNTTYSALRNAVNVKARAACPMCGDDEWLGGDALSRVPELEPHGLSIEVLPFVCRNCGFVRLHAVQPLETIDD